MPIAVWLSCSLFASALQESPTPGVRELLSRLASDDVEQRTRAAEALDRLGPAAEKELALWKDDPDPELKTRVRAQLAFLQELRDGLAATSIYQSLDEAPVEDRPFGRLNTGVIRIPGTKRSAATYEIAVGWLLSETPLRAELYQATLGIRSVARERGSRAEAGPPPDLLPGEFQALNFAAFCTMLCGGGRLDRIAGDAPDRLPPNGELALYARWAYRKGQFRQSAALFRRSRETAAKAAPGNAPVDYVRILNDGVVAYLARAAARRAADGESREVLAAWWEKIAGPSAGAAAAEAASMASLYRKMLEEDRLPAQASGKLEELFYRMRDARGTLEISPKSGAIDREDLLKAGEGELNPLLSLYDLGWEAIPSLIDHLDDFRPTRCIRVRRAPFSSPSCEILRYGDCSEFLLLRLTGWSFGRGSTYQGIQQKDAVLAKKQAASRWWADNGPRGAETYYRSLLGDDDRLCLRLSSEWLMRLDRPRHGSKILALLGDAKTPYRSDILDSIHRYLGVEEEAAVLALMKDPDDWFVLAVAEVLWRRFKSDLGLRECLGRLTKRGEPDVAFLAARFVGLLCDIGNEASGQAMLALMNSERIDLKSEAIIGARDFPDRRIAEKLLSSFEDRSLHAGLENPLATGRVCDWAALSLCGMLRLPAPFSSMESNEVKDREILTLRKGWDETHASLNWSDLRREPAKPPR